MRLHRHPNSPSRSGASAEQAHAADDFIFVALHDTIGRFKLPSEKVAGLDVRRQVTVLSEGAVDFARTIDTFTNPTGAAITTAARVTGHVADGAAVVATSDGDAILEPTDRWFITDDADDVLEVVHDP